VNARLFALAVAVAAGAGACSAGAPGDAQPASNTSDTSPGASAPVNPNITGSLQLRLTLPGGESIENVSWAITGPDGLSSVVQSGTQTVNALAVNFLVGSLPAASGYRIALSGSSANGVTCTGGEDFAVMAHATTTVGVAMACSSAPAGSIGTLVNGQTYDCAAITGVSASPTTLSVGGSVTLSATADAPVMSELTYAWSAPSGSFSAPSSAQSSFQCTAPGTVSLTVTVADGPLPDGAVCNPATTTMSIPVTCVAASGDAGSPGVDAGSGTGMDAGAGSGDGGSPPPPRLAPAVPPWAIAMLCASLVALGLRRRAPA
jgi:hypothetical protein